MTIERSNYGAFLCENAVFNLPEAKQTQQLDEIRYQISSGAQVISLPVIQHVVGSNSQEILSATVLFENENFEQVRAGDVSNLKKHGITIQIQEPQAWLRIDNSDLYYINAKVSL